MTTRHTDVPKIHVFLGFRYTRRGSWWGRRLFVVPDPERVQPPSGGRSRAGRSTCPPDRLLQDGEREA